MTQKEFEFCKFVKLYGFFSPQFRQKENGQKIEIQRNQKETSFGADENINIVPIG